MLLKDCQIYDLKKSTLDLDLEIAEARKAVQKATQEETQAGNILKELTKEDASYAKLKKRVDKASKDLDSATTTLSKLESGYDQKLMDNKFKFIEKVLVDRKVIRGPDYKLKWGSTMQDKAGSSFASRWKELYSATLVTPKDKVWVSGAVWTGSEFKHRDAVLMKIPLEVYIEKRRRETAKSDRQKAKLRSELAAEAQKAGSRLITEEEVAELGL